MAIEEEEEDIFDKIRTQINSKLDNQRQAATVLRVIEEFIREQNEKVSSISHFGAMMAMLEQQQQGLIANETEQVKLITAITYLLSFVFPRIPPAVFRMKLSNIAEPLLSTLSSHLDNAPIVKSVTSCIACLLLAQDAPAWSHQPASNQLYNQLLCLTLDARPKVRRKAQEALKRILSLPPLPSTLHPCTIGTIEYCNNWIDAIISEQSKQESELLDKKNREQTGLHLLGFLKALLPVLVSQCNSDNSRDTFETLCLNVIKLAIKGSAISSPIMTQLVYETLSTLFPINASHIKEGDSLSLSLDAADNILQALIQVQPNHHDTVSVATWLGIVSQGLVSIANKLRQCESDPNMKAVINYASNRYRTIFASIFVKAFTPYLGSSNKSIIIENTVDALVKVIRNGILDSMLLDAASGKEDMLDITDDNANYFHSVIKLVNSSLSNVRYRDAWGGILKLSQALFERCGQRHFTLVRNTLIRIICIRDNESYANSFPCKSELEASLEHAARCFGTELFLSSVSLNVEKENLSEPPRPYLLSLFGRALQHHKPCNNIEPFGPPEIKFFVSHWIPFAARMMEKSAEYKAKNKELEYKLYETLAMQAWELLPGICASRPSDVPEQFSKLGPTLGRILQTPPESVFANHPTAQDLRPIICTSLSNVVEAYLSLSSSINVDEESEQPEVMRLVAAKQRANAGLLVLKSYTSRFLSVLCNNYTQVSPGMMKAKSKGQALQEAHEKANQYYEQAISSFLKIVDSSIAVDHFLNVLKVILVMNTKEDTSAQQVSVQQIYSIHDLLMMMLPHLPQESIHADSPALLFYNLLLDELNEADALLQKRVYRCLSVQIDMAPHESLDLKRLVTRLMDAGVVANCTSGAKKSRLGCLGRVVEKIPINDTSLLLEFVPMVLSEAILGTKEASEKARSASYECLVAMGHKMLEGGRDNDDETLLGHIEQDEGNKLDEDGNEDSKFVAMELDESRLDKTPQQVSLQEYLMMILAGLTGGSPQMQSACISSLSRLLFEFKAILSSAMMKEMLSMVVFFVEAQQREVVKSAIGFVKVAIVCLSPDVLVDHLEIIITAILKHSRDTRSHFRQKVRHIMERLIRRFSYEAVEGFLPENDRKLLVNIRKRKERSKQHKSVNVATTNGHLEHHHLPPVLNHRKNALKQKEFEDVIRDSDSDLDSEGEDLNNYLPESLRDNSDQKKQPSKASIRENQQEVLDFLDPQVVSQVSTRFGTKKTQKPKYSTSTDGRVIINDSDENNDANVEVSKPDYYKLSQEGESAFIRLPDGRIKFKNECKSKRKRTTTDDYDSNDDQEARESVEQFKKKKIRGGNTTKSSNEKTIGFEYRSKNAGGDLKKKGKPDPYAYIPLNRKSLGKRGKGEGASTFKSNQRSAKNSKFRFKPSSNNKVHKR